MTKQPTVDAAGLALLDYPNRFPLKVFGNRGTNFEALVLELVKGRCPAFEAIEVRRRESKGGKYVALTLTFTAYNQQQIEEIYRDLYDCEHVVMSL